VYTVQHAFDEMQSSFMQSIFTPTTFANSEDARGLAGVMESYLEDVNIQEPRLLKLYDALLPQIDSALGGPPPVAPKSQQLNADSKPGARD
jgi:hypothetical protein